MSFIEGPLHRLALRVHSKWAFRRKLTLGQRMPLLQHVPPLSFLPTSAVYSTLCLAGLLHPAPGHGVRPVSRSLYRSKARVPRRRFIPSKLFPPWQLLSTSRARRPSTVKRFPLAVGSWLFDSVLRLHSVLPLRVATSPCRASIRSTSGLHSARKSVAFLRCCHRRDARCSLGLMLQPLPAPLVQSLRTSPQLRSSVGITSKITS